MINASSRVCSGKRLSGMAGSRDAAGHRKYRGLGLFNIMLNLIHSPYTIHTRAMLYLYPGYGVSMVND